IDKHCNGATDSTGQLEQVFHHVPVRVLDIDDDNVRLQCLDDPGHAVHLLDDRYARVPRLPQAFLYDGGANGVFIDDQNGELSLHHSLLMPQCSKHDKQNKLFFVRIQEVTTSYADGAML